MKALIQLVPRFGEPAAFEGRVREIAEELRAARGSSNLRVNSMWRLSDDPFGRRCAFRATLELIDDAAEADRMSSALDGIGRSLEDVAHGDLSVLLLGEDLVFIEPPHAPLRLQYLMRRKAGLTREQYLDHYREKHAQFGLRTPGISGYVQFHVDTDATRQVAAREGFAGWGVDSVSQLYLEDVEHFLAQVSASPVGGEAIADERTFVDRKNSVDFLSRVEWQD